MTITCLIGFKDKYINIKLQSLQCNLFLYHQFPEIDQAITHTTQCCINAAICSSGNFFETHICIMTQDNDFTLIFRKPFKHLADAVMTLPFDHCCLSTVVSEVQDFKNVFVFTVADRWCSLYFPEMINA